MLESENKEYIYRKTRKDKEEKYTLITKIDTETNNERITTSRLITEKGYYQNLPTNIKIIKKIRYCFEYKNQYFRLDLFENGLKILEIEPTIEKQSIKIPTFITLEKEVTEDKNYRNSSLYKRMNNLLENKKEKIKSSK